MNYLNKSNQITVGLREFFQTTECKMANRTCYGYTTTADGELVTIETQAAIVKWIFDSYLDGDSFGKIANGLEKQGVLSPTGKSKCINANIVMYKNDHLKMYSLYSIIT